MILVSETTRYMEKDDVRVLPYFSDSGEESSGAEPKVMVNKVIPRIARVEVVCNSASTESSEMEYDVTQSDTIAQKTIPSDAIRHLILEGKYLGFCTSSSESQSTT